MPFTAAQHAAIHARNPELLVSAAAGSGKTRVLIERIFDLISKDGLTIDRMLVVTFTHAAAAEMRERLQARLAEAAVEDRRLRAQAEKLENAQISTLHSFCQKVVQEYFQMVDIDPQAMLGDENTNTALRNQAIADAMERLYERAAQGEPNATSLTAKFTDTQIEGILNALYFFLIALPNPLEWLTEAAEKAYTLEDVKSGAMADAILQDTQLLVSGAAELAAQSLSIGEAPYCPPAYLPTMQSDAEAVAAVTEAAAVDLLTLQAAAAAFSLSRLPTVKNLEGVEADLRDRYKENREAIKKLMKKVEGQLPADAEAAIGRLNAMQPSLRALRDTMADLMEQYAVYKREKNLIDFSDLEHMTLKILKTEEIRQTIAARYDAVFVDEYQDISGVQEAILNALRQNVSRETSPVAQYYFYVGDVKQSIYRFRQADPTLFMDKAQAFSPREDAPQRRITLNANFRSREKVLAAVNRVFTHVMQKEVTEIAYDQEARLNPGLPSVGDVPMSLHLFTQAVRAGDRVKLQAYALGREIKKRVGQPLLDREGNPAGTVQYRDIAILGPKMKGVADILERTLSEMGIPVYCEDRGDAMDTEEIAQAMNHLRLMDNLADDLSLLACLRGPTVGMDERELAAIRLRHESGSFLSAMQSVAETQEDMLGKRCGQALAMLARERFLLTESPLDAYLWGWLNRSGLYAFYGCQPGGQLRQANLRMLCQKAGDHVLRRGGDLYDFITSMQSQSGVRSGESPTVLSPFEDVVRVMTIHKSKGLEFPIVFVMGLENGFNRRPRAQVLMHPRLGMALPYINEEARTTDDTLLKSAIAMRTQAEEKAERARLLYVAMTRARDELVLLGCDEKISPQGLVRQSPQTDAGSAYDVFGAGSMLNWVCQCVDSGDAFAEENGSGEATGVLDNAMRINGTEGVLSSQPTSFPQKSGVWRVVFHNDEQEVASALQHARGSGSLDELQKRKLRLEALAAEVRRSGEGELAALPQPEEVDAALAPPRDPVAPAFQFAHHPWKTGVTALARAQQAVEAALPWLTEPDADDPAQTETVELKRLPLDLARPKLMGELPQLPAFLQPPVQQTGLMRGVATHKALSLLGFAALHALPVEDVPALRAEVLRQLSDLEARRLLTPEECAWVEADAIVRFLQSPTGQGALAADVVRREWNFNLRLPEQGGLIVQGVIDLCYQQAGRWVLVDYKTDRVETAEALWPLYGTQIELYRRALNEATGLPVASATLYSLSLGQGATR